VPERVFVAADIGAGFLERISADPAFEVSFRDVRTEEELAEGAREADVLVTRHHNRVTRRVLEGASRLRLLAQGTSGLDNIDLEYARERGISVVGLPGENANAVAELVISHMIALTRTVPAYGEMIRSGVWQRADCAGRRELSAHTLGIVGIGRVGRRVAALARTFSVNVIAYDPYLSEEEINARGAARCATLEELLRRCSILSLHVPLTGETRGMIGSAEMDLLPPGVCVINTCRGQVLDQSELFARLKTGRIAGAALDVYEEEPPRNSDWPDRSRLILTPHVAGCTGEARESIGRLLYERISEFFASERR
jgi:D-3-phosphoglycerate dehydrogenase